MKKKGLIKIEEGLELNSPTAEVNSVSYSWQDNTVKVEIHFKEEGANFNHSRTFDFTNESGAELTSADVLELLKSNKVLKQFS